MDIRHVSISVAPFSWCEEKIPRQLKCDSNNCHVFHVPFFFLSCSWLTLPAFSNIISVIMSCKIEIEKYTKIIVKCFSEQYFFSTVILRQCYRKLTNSHLFVTSTSHNVRHSEHSAHFLNDTVQTKHGLFVTSIYIHWMEMELGVWAEKKKREMFMTWKICRQQLSSNQVQSSKCNSATCRQIYWNCHIGYTSRWFGSLNRNIECLLPRPGIAGPGRKTIRSNVGGRYGRCSHIPIFCHVSNNVSNIQ